MPVRIHRLPITHDIGRHLHVMNEDVPCQENVRFLFGMVTSSYIDVLSERNMYVILIFKWKNLKLKVYNFASNVVCGGKKIIYVHTLIMDAIGGICEDMTHTQISV